MEKPLEYMACQGNSIRLFGTLWDLIYMTFLMKAYVIENFRCPAEEWSYVYGRIWEPSTGGELVTGIFTVC